MSLLELFAIGLASLVAVPFLVFCAQCLSALVARRQSGLLKAASFDGSVVVMIPAHNEGQGITDTLSQLIPTLPVGGRVLVIADNCTDNTALIARAYDCDVLERFDETDRGKGYALQNGYQYLRQDPPDILIVIDADCRVSSNLVSELASSAVQLCRPVQSLNLSFAGDTSGGIHSISELGFRFKNLVRPTGLKTLGLPCHLMGTGMAIPWNLLSHVDFGGGELAEDMQLGVNLALAGYSAAFCPNASITSLLPSQDASFVSQRTRWEQGHLNTICQHMPRLIFEGIRQRRLDLLSLGMDLLVPPFSLLVLMWGGAVTAAAILGLAFGLWLPVALLLGVGGMTGLTIFAAWFRYCQAQIPLGTLASIPFYIARKIPIYLRYFLKRGAQSWVRTDRENSKDFEGVIDEERHEKPVSV